MKSEHIEVLQRVDRMLSMKVDESVINKRILELWIKIDPKNELRREWLTTHRDACVIVIWVVVHGLRIAIRELNDMDKQIKAHNFLIKWFVGKIIQWEAKPMIAHFTKNILPILIHLVLDNIPMLIEQTNPCINFASSELSKFDTIPLYSTHLNELAQDLENIYFIYTSEKVGYKMPPELIKLAETLNIHITMTVPSEARTLSEIYARDLTPDEYARRRE
jgi:hypothetical protein